jgi:nucleotide-binding universal stress UspA family protein
MKNILVCIDFDDHTDMLIGKATELSQKFGSKIWLLHVAAPQPEFVTYEGGPQFIRETRATELRHEHKMLTDYSQQLRLDHYDAEGLLIQGATVETIFEESEKLNIDLIIAGHHEHSFFYNLFMGSTSGALLKRSKIPLLTIPLG